MRFLLFPFLLAALLASGTVQAQHPSKPKPVTAKHKVKAKPMTTAAKAPVAAQPVIIFRRTPCYGTCPHYDASFYPDGRMQYEGFANAPAQGKHEVKLAPAVINRILQDAEKIGFFQMKEQYPTNFTDMPSTFLIIRRPDGTMKTVQAEENFPPALQKLFDSIHQEVVNAFAITK